MTVQLGDINTNLTLSDNYSEVLNRISRNIEKMVEIQSRGSKKVVNEADRLKASYDKIAASLDPAIARSQKYDKTVDVLKKSLAAGAISQDDFNKKLALAEQKYNGNQRVTKVLEAETRKLEKSYEKLAHNLDPVYKKTDQYKEKLATLDSALKAHIISQGTYDQRLKQLNKTLDDSNQRIARLGSNLTEVGGNLTRLSLPLAALGGYSIKAAMDFESSFAGVNKTVDGLQNELGQLTEAGRILQQGLRDLASGENPIPIDVNELNAVAEAAGQLGIKREDILAFTRTMADLGQTTNLTAEQASTSIAQFQNIFGAAGKDVDRFGSTLVALGNAGASTEKQILEMGARIAGAGVQIGLSQGEVLAFASALSSVGIESEAGGSALSKVMIDMAVSVSQGGRELHNFAEVAGMSSEQFQKAFREDAASAVESFIGGLSRLKESGGDVLGTLEMMGISEIRMRDALLRASGAGDLLADSLDLQARAWQENSALTDEAKKRYQTFESQLKITINRLKDAVITFGTGMLPALQDLLNIMTPVIKVFAAMAKSFADLPDPIKTIIIGMGGLALAAGPTVYVAGQLVSSWATLTKDAPGLVKAINAVNIKLIAQGAVIGGLLLALNALISKWKEALDAAIAYEVETGNLEGRALEFSQRHREGAKVSSEVYAQAEKDLTNLAAKMKAAENQVSKLNKTIKEGNPDQAFVARGELADAERNLRSVTGAHNRLAKSLKGVTVEQVKATTTTNQLGTGLNILGKDSDKAAKEAEKLADQLSDLLAKQREQLRYLQQQKAISSLGPGTDQQHVYEQLQKINEEHEYRLDLLGKIQQFGVKIGAQLADTDRELKKLEKDIDLKFKLQFINPKGQIPQLRSGIIDLFGGVQSAIDQGMNNLLDHLRELSKTQALDTLAGRSTDPVIQANDEMYAALASENAEFWRDYSSDVRAGWIKSTEAIKTEMEKVKEAFKSGVDGALTASEAEKELARLRRELVSAEIDHITTIATGWQQFFNQIGSMFGGFAQSVSTALSNMISTAQAFQSAGSAIGGQAGGYISAAGPFFAVAGALVGAIQADNARIAQRQYTSSVDLGFGTGQMDIMGRQGRALANSLQAALDPILDVLASTLADLPNITILAREDGKGFKVQVYDTILGVFNTMEEAMDAAVLAAVDFLTRAEGLTATMRQVLENTQAQTSEDLMRDLEFGQWYDNLGLGDVGQQIRDLFSEMRRGIDDALRLGLGTEKIKEWFDQQRREVIGGLLGVDFSAATALRNLQGVIAALDDLGSSQRARLQEQIASQERELAELIASGPRQDQETGRFESQAMWQQEIDRLRVAIRQYTDELDEIPQKLSDQEVALGVWSVFEKYLEGIGKYSAMGIKFAQMRVDLEFEETRLALVQMGLWEEWAQTFNDAYAAARREAGKPRGGRGGGAGDSVRDFIDDRRFQLSLDGMSEYRRQLAEIERQYREIGKPTAELIALRNQEIDQLNRLRNREVATNFQEFMGLVSPFYQIRKTAADLIADIKDSPFGDARKATMIGRVMGEVDRQIHRMSQEMARGLFGEMLGDLERFGAEEGLQLQLRQSMAIIEHTLKMVHYQEEIEILRAKGKLTAEQMRLLDESFAVLRNINPLTIAGGVSDRQPLTPTGQDLRDALAEREANEANQLAEALKRARESLNRYQDDGLDPLTKDLKEIFKNFAEIKLYMGATPEVVETFNKAVKNAVDRFLDPIRESQRDLFFNENSAIDPMTQWAQLQLERDSLISRFRAGDLSVVDQIAGFGSELMDLAGDVIPMGSRAYEQIQNDWDRFLSEVQISVPGMIDVDSAPMQVVGMNDLTAIGEAQVDRLDMLYASQVRTNEHLQNLNMKVGYTGGLDSVN